MKKGYLVLQDGQVFEGFRFGSRENAVGELVFTTGMCSRSVPTWPVMATSGAPFG